MPVKFLKINSPFIPLAPMRKFKVVGLVTAKVEMVISAYSEEDAVRIYREVVQARLEKQGCSQFGFQIDSVIPTSPIPRQSGTE